MRARIRLLQRKRSFTRFRQRTHIHWSSVVISVLVFNVFFLTYSYLNIGVSKKASAASSYMTAVANGNWSSFSTWSSGRVPMDGDTLVIPVGKTVTVDIVTASYSHLLIIVNGTLFFNGGKKIIMCEGMVVVATGGLLSAANSGSKFEICGSFLWDGNDPGAGPLIFGNFTTTLPVELTSFKVTPENQNVNIQWETASQVNCDYFSVERSNDGVHFSSIATVKGEGNSNQTNNYQYTDVNVPSGILYYRLTEVDFNGTAEIFNIVSVSMAPSQEVTVYPNPIPAGGTATVEIPFTEHSTIEVSMMSIEGKKIFSKTFENNSSQRNTISFETDAFPSKGTFLLMVSANETKTIKKIVVM